MKKGEHTCAYDCYCAAWMHIATYRSDFETCWQGIADHQQAPLIDPRRHTVKPCVSEGHPKVLCVYAVHEMAQLPAPVLA